MPTPLPVGAARKPQPGDHRPGRQSGDHGAEEELLDRHALLRHRACRPAGPPPPARRRPARFPRSGRRWRSTRPPCRAGGSADDRSRAWRGTAAARSRRWPGCAPPSACRVVAPRVTWVSPTWMPARPGTRRMSMMPGRPREAHRQHGHQRSGRRRSAARRDPRPAERRLPARNRAAGIRTQPVSRGGSVWAVPLGAEAGRTRRTARWRESGANARFVQHGGLSFPCSRGAGPVGAGGSLSLRRN